MTLTATKPFALLLFLLPTLVWGSGTDRHGYTNPFEEIDLTTVRCGADLARIASEGLAPLYIKSGLNDSALTRKRIEGLVPTFLAARGFLEDLRTNAGHSEDQLDYPFGELLIEDTRLWIPRPRRIWPRNTSRPVLTLNDNQLILSLDRTPFGYFPKSKKRIDQAFRNGEHLQTRADQLLWRLGKSGLVRKARQVAREAAKKKLADLSQGLKTIHSQSSSDKQVRFELLMALLKVHFGSIELSNVTANNAGQFIDALKDEINSNGDTQISAYINSIAAISDASPTELEKLDIDIRYEGGTILQANQHTILVGSAIGSNALKAIGARRPAQPLSSLNFFVKTRFAVSVTSDIVLVSAAFDTEFLALLVQSALGKID